MKPGEKGFTLIELLVVLAVVALIASAANITIFQVLKVSERNNDHTTAIRQAQQAGYWISYDTQAAQSIVTGDVPETPELEFITLEWSHWENGNVHKTTYTFHDMAGGLKQLKRHHLINDANGVEIGNELTLVAEYIDSDLTSFVEEGNAWKLTIRTCSGAETETREYDINPRVNI